jgi:type IV secretory pathway VirB10-like protein
MTATAAPAAAETPSSKEKVAKGALFFAGSMACLFVVAALFRAKAPEAPKTVTPEVPQETSSSTTVRDRAQEYAEIERSMRDAKADGPVSAAALGIPGFDTTDPMTDKALREAFARQQADAHGSGQVSAPPAPMDSPEAKAIESRRSPLRGYHPETAENAAGAKAAANLPNVPAGTVIDARLAQDLSSDYPGTPWVATLSRSVYGVGGKLAAPAGMKLLGVTEVSDGPNAVLQGRLALRLQKLILPGGREIPLAARVLDGAGIGAIPGDTNRHVLAQTLGVVAYAVVGAGQGAVTSSEPVSTQAQLQAGTIAGAGQQVQPLANKYLNVTPTVLVRAGASLRVILAAPLGTSTTERTEG